MGTIRQWNPLVNAVELIAARIEPFGDQQGRGRPLFDDKFDIAQLLAEPTRQTVDRARDFFSDFVMIQRSGFSLKW